MTTPTPTTAATLQLCSRTTIMDGEVVTIAKGFRKADSVFGGYDAIGCVQVSASAGGIGVDRAFCQTQEDIELLREALRIAGYAFQRMSDQHPYRRSNIFPRDPVAAATIIPS